MSELCLGTWGLSGDGYGPVDGAEADRVIDRAVELGIDLFDTADVYGDGAMERRLGARLPRDRTYVVTKIGTDRAAVPPRKRFELDYLRPAFERSRERLGREKIDVVLLHNPSMRTMRSSHPFDFLKELKRLGALRAWGVSAGSAEVAEAALHLDADVIEMTYNLFWSAEVHEMSGTLSGKGAAMLARSVLGHGLLSGTWTDDREFPAGDHRRDRWTMSDLRRRLSQVDAVREITEEPRIGEKTAEEAKPADASPVDASPVDTSPTEDAKPAEDTKPAEGEKPTETATATNGAKVKGGSGLASVRQVALRFALANQMVTSAVIGPRSVAQLEELVADAGSGPPYLRDTLLAELAARVRGAGVST